MPKTVEELIEAGEIEVVDVESVFGVSNISRSNYNLWENIVKYVEGKGKIVLDFCNVGLMKPWNNESFKKLIANENVYFKIYYEEQTASTIQAACTLNNTSASRVILVKSEPKPTAAELKHTRLIAERTESIKNYTEVKDGTLVINLCDYISNLRNTETIEACGSMIKETHKKHQISKALIRMGCIEARSSTIRFLGDMLSELSMQGIEVQVECNDASTMERININCKLGARRKYPVEKRDEYLTKNLPKGEVGLLIEYEASRSLDDFGRQGNGKALTCKIAQYIGRKERNNYVLVFNVYKERTFFTKEHWALVNDGEMLRRLEVSRVEADLVDLGYESEFLGHKYHFVLPNKSSNDTLIAMMHLDEEGKVRSKKLSVPERIKVVFDDWEIPYLQDRLDKFIEESKNRVDNDNG